MTSTGPEGSARQAEDALSADAGAGCHEHATLILKGVTCPSCREVVAAELRALRGVVSAQVSLAPPRAEVVYCDMLDARDLVHAVEGAGYEASVED